ncbi:MAG: hypothetical protein QXK06_05715 [Candidatus Diapherotrites archaeon]
MVFWKTTMLSLTLLLALGAFAQTIETCGDNYCSENESAQNCPMDCLEQPTGFFGLGDAGNFGAIIALALIAIAFAIYMIRSLKQSQT